MNLTPLGRRILQAQVRRAQTLDDVGAAALAKTLDCTVSTARQILTVDEPSRFIQGGRWAAYAALICRTLSVKREWLFDLIVIGDTGGVDWEVERRAAEVDPC